MRKLGITIVVVIVFILLAAWIAPHFLNVNQYRGAIQSELQQRLGRPVELGNMRLSLLPPKFRVDNVRIGEDPRFGRGNFATAQQLDVSVQLRPLLHKEVAINSLYLNQPRIELIRNTAGQWNFSTLGQNSPQPAPQQSAAQPQATQPSAGAQTPQPAKPSGGQEFSLGELKISDGTLQVTDEQKGQTTPAVYSHIDADLRDFAPNKPFDLTLAAHLPGGGAGTIKLDATAGPVNQANMMATPLDGNLKMNQVSLAGLKQFANLQALQEIDGVISGTTHIRNQDGKISSNGTLQVADMKVRGANVGYPISANYNVADDLSRNFITVGNSTIKLGSMPLNVDGTVNAGPNPPQLDLKLNAKDVSISDAMRLAAAFGVGTPQTKVDGRANANVRAQGPATKPALNGTLEATNLSASGGGLPQPVKINDIKLNLTPQQIASNDFQATSGGTSLGIRFTLAGYTGTSPNMDANVTTNNANINELLNMAKAYGVGSVKDFTGSGMLALNIHAAGPLKNASAMKFNGTGQLRNASLKSISMSQPLNLASADLQLANNSATVQNLAASIGETDARGQMTISNFSAPQLQFNLSANKINVGQLQQILSPGAAQQNRKTVERNGFWRVATQANAQNSPARSAALPAPSILENMTGSGQLAIGNLVDDQLLIQNIKATVTLNRGIVQLSPLTANLYGGTEQGAVTVDTRTNPLKVNLNTRLQQVQANGLLSAVSPIKNQLYGLLFTNAQASFSAVTANDIARTLNGQLALNLTNGSVAGVNLLNELASIGKFTGLRQNPQAATNIAKLSGNFNVVNGVATTNNLQADLAGTNLAGNGSLNLASQAIDMHVTAVMTKGVTQQVGSVAGLMQTALQNNRGELVMPVVISGTFQHPQFAPDTNAIAQMKMKQLLPSSTNPGGLTTSILGSLGKGAATSGQTPAGTGGLGGVIGAITGQGQSQGQQPAATAQPQGQPGQPANAQPSQPQSSQQQPSNPIGQAVQSILGGNKKQDQQKH